MFEILETACDIIEHESVAAVTFDRLATSCNLGSLQVVFYRFGSKAELHEAIVKHAIETDRKRVIGRYVAINHPATAALTASARRAALLSLV